MDEDEPALTEERRESAQPFVDALSDEGFPPDFIQLPGDEGYESNRKDHFNHDTICHPLLFVRPSTTAEVATAVRAYRNGLGVWKEQSHASQDKKNDGSIPRLCICGGRHSIRSLSEGAFILDLSLMQQVEVDPVAQTVTVEAGVRIGTMLEALEPYHLSPVTGTHTDTGVVGLTLGGGQGFLSKAFGPAVDQIVSAEIVLSDGSVRSVCRDRPSDDDVLFNIRGGGGNIGVLTKLTMKVYPVRNLGMLQVINLVFTQKGVEDILTKYGEWSSSSPADCTSVVVVPIGAPVVVIMGISCNSSFIPQDVDASVAAANVHVSEVPGLSELKANRLGAWFRLKASFSVKDFHKEAMHDTSMDVPGNFYYTNMFIPKITPKLAAIFAEAQRGKVAKGVKGAVLLFNHAGEKTEEVPPTETAFEMRDKKYWLLCQCEWETTGNKDRDKAARERAVEFNRWFRRSLIDAGAQRTIHAVTNMEQDFDTKTDRGLFFQEVNRERIIQTQNALDPDGIFSMNRAVN